MYEFVRRELNKGRQVYFVCALVDDSDMVNAKAATEYVKDVYKRQILTVNIMSGASGKPPLRCNGLLLYLFHLNL